MNYEVVLTSVPPVKVSEVIANSPTVAEIGVWLAKYAPVIV